LATTEQYRLSFGSTVISRPALDAWDVQAGGAGSVLVRVHSTPWQGRQLPDAVFTFRPGDPQYEYWQQQLVERDPT
jgi:hypothetical protein